MRKSLVLAPAVLLGCALAGLSPAFAQDDEVSHNLLNAAVLSTEAEPASTETEPVASPALPAAPSAPAPGSGSSPRVGIGVMIGTLGVGGQVAVRVLRPLNVRVGFSGFGTGYNFSRDGIDYGARLRLEGAQATADYFFFRGIHVSGGALLYNGIQVTGSASVPSGSTFSLNSVTYESSAAAPITGTAAVTFQRVAPVLLFGFGNLVPRGSRHWSITADFGAAFSGSPKAALSLGGQVCAPGHTSGATCQDVAIPSVQANVIAEQNSLNSKMNFLKIFPLISLGFGYAF